MAGKPQRFPFAFPPDIGEPEELARLRAHAPVSRVLLPTGDQAWLVTRHRDVQQVLKDPRLSRAAAETSDAPRQGRVIVGDRTLIGMDDPEHNRLRRVFVRHFTMRRVDRLRPWTQDLADRLLDELIAGGPPGDLVAGFAQPIPLKLVLSLLGVPDEDSDLLREWTDVALSMSVHTPEEITQTRGDLENYVREMIEFRRREPTDDLLGVLVTERDETGRLTEEELLAFVFLLMTAGHHSTVNAISTGILALLHAPDQFRRLRDDPELIPTAVEELLRYNPSTITGAMMRVALENVELGGITVPAGEGVLAAIGSANHDETVFPAAHSVDIDRMDNPHLAFGYGIHYCLGAPLARMELQVAIATLIRRLPTMRLAVPVQDLEWRSYLVSRALSALPVMW
ncbi:MAG: cytochrome P450 [Pseudonocardiales bacterium]|nr:cytochrome P450 [Pseudonocardiales bacterium]